VSTKTGDRHLEGIKAAINDHEIQGNVEIHPMDYVTEHKGEEKLLEAINEGLVDIVLGPTDSGVYIPIVQQQENLGDKMIPVISSLVTAEVANEPDGWLFRTNVDVIGRSGAIYDHLARYWVNSIAVLYADTAFGRQAEQAFHEQLSSIQRENYVAIAYKPPYLRPELREIMDLKPEAVGIFAEREDILTAYQTLRSMNVRSTPYRPMLFTILDLRLMAGNLDNFFFVSVIPPGQQLPRGWDDVSALSYDTTTFVLDELSLIFSSGAYDKTVFRNRFVNVLKGAGERAGPRTNMRFSGMSNTTDPQVYHLSGGDVIPVYKTDVGLVAKISHKFKMFSNRFGWWHYAVVITMLLTLIVTSTHDIYRWYGGSFKKLIFKKRFFSGYFLLLVGVQGLVALAIFVFLGETGRVRYDSIINGFIIALAPSPLLRANFANIKGSSIGVGEWYDQFLQFLTQRLLRARYKDIDINIRVLAYYNSEEALKNTLKQVHASLPNRDEGQKLNREMEDALEDKKTQIGKRKYLASRLVKLRTWEDLYRLNCVPKRMRNEVHDPEALIFDSVNYCLTDTDLKKKLTGEARKRVKEASDEVVAHYKKKYDEAKNPRDHLFVAAQFLIMRFNYKRTHFEKLGLVPSFNDELKKMKEEVYDPEVLISECVEHCLADKNVSKQLIDEAEKRVGQASDEVKERYKKKYSEAGNHRDRLFVAAQFLIMHFDYEHQRAQLEKLNLVSPA
jgi:hypothetical protein